MCKPKIIPRYLLTIIIIALSLPLMAQIHTKDTIFIQKDKLLGTAQSIYIEYTRDSKLYDDINYWNFLKFDTASYEYSTDYLFENKQILTKNKPVIPFTKWITLKLYKGNFYTYKPCDFYTHFRVSINDSSYIDWTGEGPVANKILAQNKINNTTYEFKLTGMYEKERKLIIHIINEDKGIAVFEETNNGADKKFYLMISADKIKTIPLIVNSCKTHKQRELQFEEPDFVKLLKNK